jgi:hypothetical protein
MKNTAKSNVSDANKPCFKKSQDHGVLKKQVWFVAAIKPTVG